MRPTFDMDWLDVYLDFLLGLDVRLQAALIILFFLSIGFVLHLAYLEEDRSYE